MSKKLVQINVTCNGSTGRIMTQIQEEVTKEGWEAYSFYGRGKPANDKCIKIGNKFDVLFHVLVTRLFDLHGYASKRATKKMIKQIKSIDPDVIQLHNLHGYYLNINLLFKYLKTCDKKIVWTLHDCWAFTGHCTHFTYPECNKWKNEKCSNCSRKRQYPASLFIDNSSREIRKKKQLFTNINKLIIVTPSEWLKNLVKQSFLKDYTLKVINNGIDLTIFKPTKTIDVKRKYNIPDDKKIILGVASIWSSNKGLNEFFELSKQINEKNFCIVLVGLNKKQIKKLPSNIIGISRIENLEELANLYTCANVLFNPSKEESFSLVTVEAMACGTPVIGYNNSAIKEFSNLKICKTLSLNDNDKFNKIIAFCKEHTDIDKNVNKFSIKFVMQEYMNLYKNL